MGLRINTNVAALGAQRSLHAVTTEIEGSFRRLSSGLRIATAADDAAGLGISNSMRSRIRSWGAALRNIDIGIGIAQTAEGALQEVSSMLGRLRELLVQGSNGTLQTEDRAVLDVEYQALLGELDRVSAQTTFNGIELLSGNPPGVRIQAGIDSGQILRVRLADVSSDGLGLAGTGVGLPAGPPDPIALVDDAIESVSTARSFIGADQNRLQSAGHVAEEARESLSTSESRIRDADMAHESAVLARGRIIQEAASSVLIQANSQPDLALGLIGS